MNSIISYKTRTITLIWIYLSNKFLDAEFTTLCYVNETVFMERNGDYLSINLQ